MVTYSSTVATNALLELKGARVALFTNARFEDLIEIGRQNRLELYALSPSRPMPLVPRAMRFGVEERTLFDGTIATPLTREEFSRIAKIAATKQRRGLRDLPAAFVCESARARMRLPTRLKPLGRPVSVSHRILAEYREFERLSTTVVNAYVAPKMASHLENLETRLEGSRLARDAV